MTNKLSATDQRFASAAMLVEYITRADVLSGGEKARLEILVLELEVGNL